MCLAEILPEKPLGLGLDCRITPQGVANLLVAGRSISCDFEAFSSTRINATCMAVGEFAGHAAREIISSGDIRKLDVPAVRERVRCASCRFFAAPLPPRVLPQPWYEPPKGS